jgi:hypothetical protein
MLKLCFGLRLAQFAAAILSTLFGFESAYADIQLRLNFTLNLTTNSGRLSVADELDFVLKGKDVEVYHRDGNERILVAKRSVGKGDYYGPGVFSTKVADGKLFLTGTGATHTVTVVITTDGKTTCNASVDFHLNSGKLLYELMVPGYGRIYVTTATVENISCQLS